MDGRFLAELSAGLAAGMSSRLHWFPEDVAAHRLAAVLAGMANGSGGNVLVGIAPRSGQVVGVRAAAEAYDRIFQAVLLCDPALILPMPQQITLQEKTVILIHVPAGLPNVYSLDGRYLGREGTQTNPLPARELRRLLVERSTIQFESQTPYGASLDDLDLQLVQAYVSALNWHGGESWQQVLLRRGCLRQAQLKSGKSSEYQPTYAALLLFGFDPQRWLPNAAVLAARFSEGGFSDRFVKQEIRGTLPQQLQQAELFFHDQVPREVRLEGLAHQEMPEYPPEAVRELLVNAVAHRDYSLAGDGVHFNLFADRIEIHSPGGLPGPVTLDNLLQARFSRNVVIMQVLADLGYVERLGYGLDRVVSAMRRRGLPAPRFEEVAGSFRAILFSAPDRRTAPGSASLAAYQGMGLNPRQREALSFLLIQKRITNRDLQDLCPDVHSETIRRDLADLVTRGLLIKVGDKKSTYYILK